MHPGDDRIEPVGPMEACRVRLFRKLDQKVSASERPM
jgi:hypothetical protein